MKNRTLIIIFTTVILLCAFAWLLISSAFSPSDTVAIYKEGELIEKIDLGSVTEDREITLSGKSGQNVILVSHGSIKMKSADCPDKICVNHGELKAGGTPIVCLPNKIVIEWTANADRYDIKAGGQ